MVGLVLLRPFGITQRLVSREVTSNISGDPSVVRRTMRAAT
jgi:hypothetical protein